MTPLPRLLKRYQKQAEEWLSSGFVKDIEFSGTTYQVLVNDPLALKDEWAFIQLDELGKLENSFCSCQVSEDQKGCPHQAVAYLYIYHGHDLPLHRRFSDSLWNSFFLQCAHEFGVIPLDLKKKTSGCFAIKIRGKDLCTIEAHGKEAASRLEKMILHREKETEENSLKFSNATLEEIDGWEKGKPPFRLAYELSLWNDLARWMMQLQERESSYSIAFNGPLDQLPQSIAISFSELSIQKTLSQNNLESLITTLSTVESSLKVFDRLDEEVEKIVYNEEKGRFEVRYKEQKDTQQKDTHQIGGIEIGRYLFVFGKGFYAKEYPLLKDIKDNLSTSELLKKYPKELKKWVKDIAIKEVPRSVSYFLAFDANWNLHIESYLFERGDLQLLSLPSTFTLKDWVYIAKRGFYRLEPLDFNVIDKVVAAQEVEDFINEHRIWLNGQEGFAVRLSSLESTLSYAVSDQYLRLDNVLREYNEKEIAKQFGRWGYIQGEGFFSASSTSFETPFKKGVRVPLDQISSFIKFHLSDLKEVSGFFSRRCPVDKAELIIEAVKEGQISIKPQITFAMGYQVKDVLFFDEFTYVEGEGFYELPIDKQLPLGYSKEVVLAKEEVSLFIETILPRLLPIASYVTPSLCRPLERELIVHEIESREDLKKVEYSATLDYRTEFGSISIASLWKAFQEKEKKRFLVSPAGLIDLQGEEFLWLKNLKKSNINLKDKKIDLSLLELMRLQAIERVSPDTEDKKHLSKSNEILASIAEMKVPSYPNLEGFKSHLRSYQEAGVRWLWFLYYHGLSGLLCDDMGLGKTHQAMGLLVAISNIDLNIKRKFLVVCPTSVIYHWKERIAEFLPFFRVCVFHGSQRNLYDFNDKADVLLTSYGVWRNEIEMLSKISFEVAIFDELQIAKNHASQVYKTLLKAKARMRLGLTGTPIENRLRELKTLFDIVLPTYMPAEKEYLDTFVRPIERDYDAEKKLLLTRLIKPFVMRRKKEDVLLDLPAKTEQIAHCDLHPGQAALYQDVLKASSQDLIETLQDSSTAVPYLHIFSLLSQLKQICNHPASYYKTPQEYEKYPSGKWDLFVELLEEARQSGQKVVVFSQYLAMQDIIELYLKKNKIDYAAIRGKTINRGEQLEKFNKDKNCSVFIASLQAVGLGVDLTAASVVIHYDRWWNSARENQATDRVHRIGQTRGVQVFKLMTLGTLEEHIDAIISKKSRLLEEIVAPDEQDIMKKFDRNEMIALLQLVPKSG